MINEKIVKIYRYRATLWDMSIRQFKLSFAGFRFGIWWAFITPLLLALSINFVFSVVLKMNMPNYTAFVLCGIMPWFFLTASLQEATTCLIGNLPILKQSIFPREFIPLSVIISNLMNFLMGYILFLPFFIFVNVNVLKFIFLLPLIIVFETCFVMGLGLLFSFLNIIFRDLSRLLVIIFMIWFWVTPVFYSMDMLDANYRWVCLFNPATHFITFYQDILFYARMPSLLSVVCVVFFALAPLVYGFYFFAKNEPSLLKRI